MFSLVLNSANKVEVDINLLGVFFLLVRLGTLMHHNLFDKLPHDFGCQLLDIGVPIHNSHEAVGVQHGVLPIVDFLLQLAGQGKQLLLFNFIATGQRLKLYFGQVFQCQLLEGFAEQLIQVGKALLSLLQLPCLGGKFTL